MNLRINGICRHFLTEVKSPAFYEPVVPTQTANKGVHCLQGGQFEVAGHSTLSRQLYGEVRQPCRQHNQLADGTQHRPTLKQLRK